MEVARDIAERRALRRVREAYAAWSATYERSGHNPLTAAAEELLGPWLRDLRGQRLLDLACGDGRVLGLARQEATRFRAGLDFSRGMLLAARRRHPDTPLIEAELCALPLAAESFDRVALSLALSHLPRIEVAVFEMARVLAPGGRLLLIDLHPDAAERGWTRSFRDAAGRRRRVDWWPQDLDRIEALCRAAGLEILRRRERALDPTRLPPDAPPSAGRGLALYAIEARKPAEQSSDQRSPSASPLNPIGR